MGRSDNKILQKTKLPDKWGIRYFRFAGNDAPFAILIMNICDSDGLDTSLALEVAHPILAIRDIKTAAVTKSLPLDIIEHLLRIRNEEVPAAGLDNSQKDHAFLKKVRRLIEANFQDFDFGIDRICRLMAVSRSKLHRKLKAGVNLSASLYIRAIRLNKAWELLLTTDMNISEIAYEVGFKNPSYFSRMFKKEFGMAPSSVRV